VVVFLQNVKQVILPKTVLIVLGKSAVVGQQFIIPNHMEDILLYTPSKIIQSLNAIRGTELFVKLQWAKSILI